MEGVSRDTRRCALQVLYQFDSIGDSDPELVRGTLVGSQASEESQRGGFDLALEAWARREEADALVRPLSPDWPTHRQPLIDRNILRIALYEIRHAGTAGKVAINGAVELAKEYGGDKSSGFVNAILDRIWKGDGAAAPTPDVQED